MKVTKIFAVWMLGSIIASTSFTACSDDRLDVGSQRNECWRWTVVSKKQKNGRKSCTSGFFCVLLHAQW